MKGKGLAIVSLCQASPQVLINHQANRTLQKAPLWSHLRLTAPLITVANNAEFSEMAAAYIDIIWSSSQVQWDGPEVTEQ